MRHTTRHTMGGKISEFSTLSIIIIICWICSGCCSEWGTWKKKWQRISGIAMFYRVWNSETLKLKTKATKKEKWKKMRFFLFNRKLWNWNAFWNPMPAFHPIVSAILPESQKKSAVKWPTKRCYLRLFNNRNYSMNVWSRVWFFSLQLFLPLTLHLSSC